MEISKLSGTEMIKRYDKHKTLNRKIILKNNFCFELKRYLMLFILILLKVGKEIWWAISYRGYIEIIWYGSFDI